MCFTEEPVTSAIPPEVREHCEGREVSQLNPADCGDERDNSARGSFDLEEDIRTSPVHSCGLKEMAEILIINNRYICLISQFFCDKKFPNILIVK